MSVAYYGDFAEDATVYIPFNTFTSDDPSASCTITNLVNTDIHIHKDNGTTQRNNAAGITMSVDFDSITGNHLVTIDTSDDTVAGFWVVGHDYFVRMEGTTVDGATINAWIGSFSIENRFKEVDVTHILGHLLTQTGTQLGDGFEKFFNVSSPTGTVNSLPGAAPDAAGGLPISDAGGLDLDTQIKTNIDAIVAFWNVFILTAGTIGAVGNDTTHLHLTGLTYGDDELNDYIIVIYDVSTSEYHSAWISDWDNASALATVATLAFTPQDSTDTYWVFALRKHPSIADILADTNEIQGKLPTNKFMGSSDGADDDGTLNSIQTATGTTLEGHLTDIKGTGFAKDTHSLTNIEGYADLIDDGTSGLAKIATDAAAILAHTGTDGVVLKAAGLDSDAVDEIWAKAMSDLAAGAPSATCSVLTAINYLYEALRNKNTRTASELAIFKDDASTKLCEADLSDDGTTFTKGELRTAD